MNKTRLLLFSLLLFFFGSFKPHAQINSENEQTLATVLDAIEAQYNITFTYADATLYNIAITKLKNTQNLDELLTYLSDQTGLSFQKLDDTNIVITRDVTTEITTTQFLEEVVVTNYLTRGISLKTDGIISIKPKQFGILPGLIEPDVLHTIQALPGIISVDERVSNLNVHGGTHDQNLILWEGIKMYQSGHFFGLISAFSPYLTENVIVSKNGTSAMYGDGISSIIDMRNSNSLESDFTGGAGVNLISADGYAKIPLTNKINLQLSARRSFTDVLTTPTFNKYFNRIFQDTDLNNQNNNSISQNERFYFYDVSGKLLYDISEKDKIRLSAITIYNNLDYDEQSTINNVTESLRSNLIQQNIAAGIEYRRNWNEKLNTSVQFNLSNYNLDATNVDVLNNVRLEQENKVLDFGVKLHVNYELEKNLNYFGGYQFKEVGVSNLEDVNNPDFRRFSKDVIKTHSLFNEIKFLSNSRKTSIRIGLRTNYISKFSEFFVEPRLSFSQKLFKNFRLELLGELKSQTTSQIIDLQNDFLGVEKRRWIVANNTTVPITQGRQFSAGFHYKKEKLVMSIEGFIKDVDGITTRSQGFQNQYQFLNSVGRYRIRGVDFLINKQFNKISTWLSYSFSKNNYRFNDLNFGNRFPNTVDIRHALTFAGTYTYNNLKLALGLNWHTGKPFTEPNKEAPITNSFINYSSPNAKNINDYLRLDMSATYNFKLIQKNDALIGFSIWNILDRNNTINKYYTIRSNNSISNIENRSLGITPNLSFRVKF